MNRRSFLTVAAAALFLETSWSARAQSPEAKVKIILSYDRGLWYYDPVGLYVAKGDTVEWTAVRGAPSVNAFHPSYENHE